MKIIFNSVKIQELDEIMEIENAGFNSEEAASREAMQERIQMIPDTFIVAHDENGKVLGYIVGPASKERYITDDLFEKTVPNQTDQEYQTVLSLAVSPDYQGTGIGGMLLDQLAKTAKKAGRSAITLTCLERLQTFYENHGYVSEGVADSQHAGEVWYNMVKKLNN